MTENANVIELLRLLWIDRESMHETLDRYWNGDGGDVDCVIEELSEDEDSDLLLQALRQIAEAHGWGRSDWPPPDPPSFKYYRKHFDQAALFDVESA